MADIQTRADIERLVETFYQRLLQDEVLRPFFTEVVELDLEQHLPIIGDFWESILLGNIVYRRNAMEKHLLLHEKKPLQPEHFRHWIDHWQKTVDGLFAGPVAKEAKRRAGMISQLMQHKVANVRP